MTAIKSFTNIPQSKKLAEILPLESADMWYQHTGFSIKDGSEKSLYFPMVIRDYKSDEDIPCWSLAALLDIIPKHIKDYNVLRIDISEKDFAIWYDEVGFGVNNDLPDITADNPVDACYEFVLKLNELNLL